MSETDIREKIILHINGLNEVERKQGTDGLIKLLSTRYDVPKNMVVKILAEWSAGGHYQDEKFQDEE